ncbi:MAG TPA: nickel pincer cofactor biosynthesis protein LarB [Actinomycetota bacterium]|nr:nickel pincer cofactor biosynthesis protein LarB [Actinomycetota bacterium]
MDHIAALRARRRLDDAHARLDLHRQARTGMPEVIYSPGKTVVQMRSIARVLLERSDAPVIATKATREMFSAVRDLSPTAAYNETARTIVLRREHGSPIGRCMVVTAGTSDIPVAEEAAVTADACGAKVERVFDVGVAGIHRILGVSDDLRTADVIIVAAGMEGALPSVVGGLVQAPVVAVPTSVGYGASFGGIAALLGMLNSCSPGVAVVNIDNGFGAAAFAVRMLRARA